MKRLVRLNGWPLLAALVGAAIATVSQEPPCAARMQTFCVRASGARGDGVTDDAEAFQRTFSEAARARQAAVRVPAGRYRLSRPVTVSVDDSAERGLAVLGEGVGVSVLVGCGTNGVLSVNDRWCKTQLTVRDLSFLAAVPIAGTALEVVSPPRGARNYRTLTVENVDIRGEGTPSRGSFNVGVRAIAQWRPLFANVVFSGVSDPALGVDRSDASPLYAAEAGFVADWCYAPSFQNCYAWSAHTGYRIVSESLRPEGPEDGAFYRCTANGVRVGIDVRTPIIEPQIVIDACHVNARDIGIRLAKRKFFQITNCLLYGNDHVEARPYVDVDLSDCYGGVLTGNIFHAPTVHNLKPEPAVDRVMIRADATCRDLLVSGNIFNAKGVAVEASPQARNIEMFDNRYSNPQVRAPAGGGTSGAGANKGR